MKHQLFITLSILLTVTEADNISNNYWLIDKSAKERFLIALSVAVLSNIQSLPHLYLFSWQMRCAIFRLNIDLLVTFQHFSILHERFFNLPPFGKHLALFIGNLFQRIFTFYHFSLFLTVSEVFNISNKYWLPYKSAKKYFYTRHIKPFLCLKKNCTLHCGRF